MILMGPWNKKLKMCTHARDVPCMVEIPLPKRILLLKQIQRFKAVEHIHACICAECPGADVLVFDLNLRSLASFRAPFIRRKDGQRRRRGTGRGRRTRWSSCSGELLLVAGQTEMGGLGTTGTRRGREEQQGGTAGQGG